MTFAKKPLKWTAVGQEPSELKKSEGFKMDESPAPGHFDFMFRSTYEAIAELQQKAGKVKTVNNEQPDSNGNVTITLPDISKFYQKPTGGIPKTDLAKDVQTSLEKADSALQKVTKADVGLGNVDNTSDANKPVSTAQQAEFDKKAPIASPTFTGTPKSTTATAGTNTTQIATTAFVKTAVDNSAITINDSITTHKVDNVSHDTYVNCATASATAEKVVTANSFTVVEGARITVKFTNANTATVPTLKINTELAKPLVKADGTAFKNIKVGIYSFVYSGTSFTLLGEGGEYGNVTAADVRSTKTFGTENGVVQGTLNLNNLLAGNIKKGINIGGILGTLDIASLGGCNYASGSTVTTGKYYSELRVNGLSFMPKFIIILSNDMTPGIGPPVSSDFRVIFPYKNKDAYFISTSGGNRFMEAPQGTIIFDGFYLTGLSQRQFTFDWFAFG